MFSKSEEQIDTLVRTVHVFSTDTKMDFGMKKCGILTIKRGKEVRCEGIKLANSEVMKEVEKDRCTYLGIVELDQIKKNEVKEKNNKGIQVKPLIGPKINGSGCIQIRSRNASVENESERCGQKIKKNNDNVWSVKTQQRYGEIVHNKEKGRQKSDECETLR